MNFSFAPTEGLIILDAEVTGPAGVVTLRLALDTGATTTLINSGALVALGYEPGLAVEQVQVTTGSGVEFVPKFELSQIAVLGHTRTDFPVLCHTLPPSAGVDGLLGLDFVRGQVLTIDLIIGQITLTQ